MPGCPAESSGIWQCEAAVMRDHRRKGKTVVYHGLRGTSIHTAHPQVRFVRQQHARGRGRLEVSLGGKTTRRQLCLSLSMLSYF